MADGPYTTEIETSTQEREKFCLKMGWGEWSLNGPWRMSRDLKSKKGGWGEDVKACSMFEDSCVLLHSWEVVRRRVAAEWEKGLEGKAGAEVNRAAECGETFGDEAVLGEWQWKQSCESFFLRRWEQRRRALAWAGTQKSAQALVTWGPMRSC